MTSISCSLWWQKLNWWVIEIPLLYFHYYRCIMFTVCLSLQEKYKEKVFKRHDEGFNCQNESIDDRTVYANKTRKAHGRWDRCSVLFNFVNARYHTSYYYWLFFWRYALFDGVVDSMKAMPLRESSSSQSFGLTPLVSQIHLNYDAMKISLEWRKTCWRQNKKTIETHESGSMLSTHRCKRLWR
jgi:hypothetical protein